MKKTSLFIIAIIYIAAFNANAQNQKLSRNEVVNDIDTMLFLINEIHPNMFAVCPESKFYAEVEKVKVQLPDSMDIFGVYKELEPLTVLLGDGHTVLNFPRNRFTGEEAVFPLSVTVNSNDSTITTSRAYTIEDITIPSGAKILLINEMPYKNIIEEMLRYHSGERIFFRLEKTSVNFSDILYILYPSEKFEIEYSYNGRIFKEIINAIPRKNVQNDLVMQLYAPPLYSYVIDKEKNVAIFTIKSLTGKKKEFEQMVEQMFAEIKSQHIGNLIVDLRYNGGGSSDMGDILISYLVNKPFNQFCKSEIKVSKTVKSMGVDLPDSIGILTADTTNYIVFINPKPEEERYTGNVYVLTSHMTFSSASSLAWLLKQSGVAKIVGEETGGMSISYGNIVRKKLPASGITLAVSFAQMYLTGSDENNIHGVLPDFPVDSTDALDKALKLIEN